MTNLLYFLTFLSYLVPIWVLLNSQLIASKMAKIGCPNWLSYVTGFAMLFYVAVNTGYLVSGELTADSVSINYRMVHLILFLLPLALLRFALRLAPYVNWEAFHAKEPTRIHIPAHKHKKGA